MVRHLAGRYPLLLALVAQLGACLGVAVLLYLGAQLSAWRPSALAAALLQGLLAAGLARGLGLSRWWGWLNLGFVPGLVLVSGAALPSWVFLLGFALLVLLNWNSIGERVPLYLTGAQTRKELMALLAQQAPDFRFVDLGCGPAGSLLSLARLWAKAQAQMPAGSHLVSNTFEVPGVPADRQVELHDWRNSRLLLWQMPGC